MSKRCDECAAWESPNVLFSRDKSLCDQCHLDGSSIDGWHKAPFSPVNFNNMCELCQADCVHTNVMDICFKCHDDFEEEWALEIALQSSHHVYQFGDWRPDYTPITEVERGLEELARG